MYLKPYFYYRQQYNQLNDSDKELKEIEQEDKNISQPIENTPVEIAAAPEATDSRLVLGTTEHSRFQELAPGVFQFKHTHHNISPRAPASFRQPTKKATEKDAFLRLGTFPGASGHNMPVYQFT